MGLCLEKSRSERNSMSYSNNNNNNSTRSTKHVKKKSKQDIAEQQSNQFSHSYKQTNPTLEPRRDLPLHKIPELLAKITGTLSSTLSSSTETKPTCPSSNSTVNTIDRRLQFFKHYVSSVDEELISLDGILRFCDDLSIEPDCYEVLLFCFLCRAKQMYSLTKEEFLLGVKTLTHHMDNLLDLRTALFTFDILPCENEFYTWTYHYGLIDGQRCVTTTNAISLWRLFYSKHVIKPEIFDRWIEYLEDDVNNEIPKTITCDTWTIFPQFAKFIQLNGYEAYDDNEAWPCLFDGFVENQLGRQDAEEEKMKR